MKKNLVPVSKESDLRENGIHLKPSTLRKWHHLGIHLNLFLKVCSRLHIDLEEWNKFVESAVTERSERIARLQKLGLDQKICISCK